MCAIILFQFCAYIFSCYGSSETQVLMLLVIYTIHTYCSIVQLVTS